MDSQERRVTGLTIRIDRLLCVGFENCIEVAPHLFELDDEGVAVFCANTDAVDLDTILNSCNSCPVDAIEVRGQDGAKLVP